MTRRLAALLITATAVSLVSAGTTRIRDLTAVGPGIDENPDADGNVTLVYRPNRGQTEVHVAISDFLPHTTYGVYVTGSGTEFSNPVAITTNHRGNGHWRITVGGDATPQARATIYRWDGNPDEGSWFDVTADEIRADGDLDASVTRIRKILPAGPGATENPDGDGSAFLRYRAASDETKIHVRIRQYLPNTVYGVRVENSIGAELSNPEAITTNCYGSGRFHITLPGDYTGIVTVTIYRWDGDNDTVLEVSADELRGQGS